MADSPDGQDISVAKDGLLKLDSGSAAAFLCGSMALFLASVPTLSFMTKPLSALGLVIGIFWSLQPALKKEEQPWLPGSLVGLNLLVLLFAGSWSSDMPAPSAPLVSVSPNKDGDLREP